MTPQKLTMANDLEWLTVLDEEERPELDDIDQDIRIVNKIDEFRAMFEGKISVVHTDWLIRTLRAALLRLKEMS
jgi:hypothetical protein